MKTSSITHDEILAKKFIILLVVTGIVFSALSFFILDYEFLNMFSISDSESVSPIFCDTGLCYNSAPQNNPIFVQQSENILINERTIQDEDFSNIQLAKNMPVADYSISGNKAILFAAKDSFIREAIQNGNEGSNQVLKILGSGPTNNRALIAFDQQDIKNVLDGKELQTATLKLFVEGNNQNWGDGQLLSLHRMTTNWEEGIGISSQVSNIRDSKIGVTWICPQKNTNCNYDWDGGEFSQSPTDSIWISNQVNGYWIKFDVTNDIKYFVSSEENYGWIILKSDENLDGQINLSSREAQLHVPELVLVFSDD